MINRLLSYGFVLASMSLSAYAGDVAEGQAKAGMCAGCHGANGIGLSDEFPNLAGQKAAYLVKQLRAFKSGDRQDPSMKAMSAALSDADMQNLAAYFASLSPLAVAEKTPVVASASDQASSLEFAESTFVSMKKSATMMSFPTQAVWKGGPNMLYNAITPDGRLVLSTSPSTNTVYVFDAKSGKQLAIVAVGKAPKGVKVTPDGQYAYISNQNSANISVLDLKRLSVVATIAVEAGPHNVRFTRSGQWAYVTLQGGAGLAVIDTVTRKMTQVIPIPGITGPHNIDLSADEQTAFVRDFVHHVAVLDLRTGQVKQVIKVGKGHGGIDVAPNGKFVATAAIGADFISVFDPKTFAVKNIQVGNGPHGIRASKDSRWIYVSITKDNALVVIDAESMTVVKKIAVQKFPFWIAVQGNP